MAVTPIPMARQQVVSTLDTLENTPLVILGDITRTKPFLVIRIIISKNEKNGAKFIVVDTRYSDTASSLADQWIPILPTIMR